MSIRKAILLPAALFFILSQCVFALTNEEKEKTIMEQLATYTMAASAIKVVTEESLTALAEGALSNANAMDVIMGLNQYNHPIFRWSQHDSSGG